MIRKLLYTLLIICISPVFATYAADNVYCPTAGTLQKLYQNYDNVSSELQVAYDIIFQKLFNTMEASENYDAQLCLTATDIADICFTAFPIADPIIDISAQKNDCKKLLKSLITVYDFYHTCLPSAFTNAKTTPGNCISDFQNISLSKQDAIVVAKMYASVKYNDGVICDSDILTTDTGTYIACADPETNALYDFRFAEIIPDAKTADYHTNFITALNTIYGNSQISCSYSTNPETTVPHGLNTDTILICNNINTNVCDSMNAILSQFNIVKYATNYLGNNECGIGIFDTNTKPLSEILRTYTKIPNTQTGTDPLKINYFDIIDDDIFIAAFDSLIAPKTTSVLHGTGKDFLTSAKQYNVDPFLMVGISSAESGLGTSNCARTKNNIAGFLNSQQKCITYDSVADSIAAMARKINKDYDPPQLSNLVQYNASNKYCWGACPVWIPNITQASSDLRRKYNTIVDRENQRVQNLYKYNE